MANSTINGVQGLITSSFQGATAVTPGGLGGVPIPTAGQQTKFLRADGSWAGVTLTGVGTPETFTVGSIGDLYIDTSADTIYSKQTGNNTNTGWVSVGGGSASVLTYGRVNASADLANTAFSTTSPGTTIPFNATEYSSGTTFSGTTGVIPSVAGRYRATWLAQAGSGVFNGNGTFHIVQGGVSLGSVYIDMMEAAGVNQTTPTIDVNVVAGSAVTLQYQPDVADSIVWQKGSYFQLTQLSNFLPASTTTRVVVIAGNASAQSIPNNNLTTITNWTELQDPTNSFNPTTGVFTAPRDGLYTANVSVGYFYASTAAGHFIQVRLTGGGIIRVGLTTASQTGAIDMTASVAATFFLTAGQTITASTFQSSGAARTLSNSTDSNFISIVEVPATY